MARRQSLAVLVKSQADEEAGVLCIRSRRPIDSVLSKNRLDLIPQWLVDDCRMLATIDAVLKHEIKGAAGEPLTANLGAICKDSPLTPYPCGIKFCLEIAHRSE